MKTRVEIKIELEGRSPEGPRFYFVAERNPDGFFGLKFTDRDGKIVDPVPLSPLDLTEIIIALDTFPSDESNEDRGED